MTVHGDGESFTVTSMHTVDAFDPIQALADADLEAAQRELMRRRRERAPSRHSMSTLRRFEACPLSHYLARIVGDPSGESAINGRAFHECAAAIGFRKYMSGEQGVTAAEAVAIAERVLQRLDVPLRAAGRRDVLQWVRAWSAYAVFPTNAEFFAVEELWTHPLGLATASAKLDRVEKVETTVEVEDYKTGQPPYDPTYIYDAFQPKNYAWHAAMRFPDADLFLVTERFVRTGRPYTVMYDRAEVEDVIEPMLVALSMRLSRAWTSGRFDAQPGSWCARCPAPGRCPIPEDARPMTADPLDGLNERAARLKVIEARAKREREALKKIVDVLGLAGFDVGDQRLGFTEKVKQSVMGVRDAKRLGMTEERDAVLDAYDQLKVEKVSHEFGWTTTRGDHDV